MKKVYIILFFFSFLSLPFSAQTREQRTLISVSYDPDKKLIDKVLQEEKTRKKRVNRKKQLFSNRNLQFRTEEKGIIYELRDITPEGYPLYIRTYNYRSAQTIKATSLHTGGKLNLNLNGENMVAGVWDGGIARPDHIEFPNNKIMYFDNTNQHILHATHVTGTVVGEGVWPGSTQYPKGLSQGMAPKAKVLVSDWVNDAEEIMKFAEEGYLVSNHSYGYGAYNPITGFILPKWYFGAYDISSYSMDAIASSYPMYQMVFAAGNDREYYNIINPERKGFELTTGYANSKNGLTVGAIYEILNYQSPQDVVISDFSNFGPTDDGSIKPNITAKGVGVFSASNSGSSNYAVLSGTSMAAPAITGSIVLLQQHYFDLNKNYMNSATVRGLLQHTALEAGDYPGPDYKFGWGVADIETSAQVISGRSKASVIQEHTLENGNIYTKQVSSTGSEDLRISISWTDLPAVNYNKGTVDPDVRYLVNNLDVRVTDEKGNVYYPWVLDKNQPTAPAKKAKNSVDNFERIDIPNPRGIYTITISHIDNLKTINEGKIVMGESQDYTLIVTGPNIKDLGGEEGSVKIWPVPAKDKLNISVYQEGSYQIYGFSGETLYEGKLQEGINDIDISKLSSGIYIIKVKAGKTVKKKFIVE